MLATRLTLCGLLTIALLVPLGSAHAYVLNEVGEQDWFIHNQPIGVIADFQAAQSGEGGPIGWYGSDLALNADITWTHTFTPPGPGETVTLEFGLYDIDSGTYPMGGVRDVVAGFLLDGVAQDDAFFVAAGASDQACSGVYSTLVPSSLVGDGSLQVRILLTGPGLVGSTGVNLGYSSYNGAGLDFARLTAEASVPTFALSVTSAAIKWLPTRSDLGILHLWADIDADLPGPEDIVALSLDGTELFAAPFSDFRQSRPSEPYVLASRGLVVSLDFNEGRLFVLASGADLADLDPTDGVGVELWLGDAVGSESIPMGVAPGSRLVYVRPDAD